MGVDVLTSGILEFDTGIATFTCSTRTETDQRVHIYGTHGRISVGIPFNIPPDRPTEIYVTSGGNPPVAPATETLTFEPADPYTVQAEVFVAAVLDGTPLPFPAVGRGGQHARHRPVRGGVWRNRLAASSGVRSRCGFSQQLVADHELAHASPSGAEADRNARGAASHRGLRRGVGRTGAWCQPIEYGNGDAEQPVVGASSSRQGGSQIVALRSSLVFGRLAAGTRGRTNVSNGQVAQNGTTTGQCSVQHDRALAASLPQAS